MKQNAILPGRSQSQTESIEDPFHRSHFMTAAYPYLLPAQKFGFESELIKLERLYSHLNELTRSEMDQFLCTPREIRRFSSQIANQLLLDLPELAQIRESISNPRDYRPLVT